MQDTMKNLIALQQIDLELKHLKDLRGDLPNQVQKLQKKFKEAENNLIEKQDQLTQYKKEKRVAELDIKQLDKKLEKYQSQLYEVKNNKEYDAVSKEIEVVKESISEKEDRIIELIDLEEQFGKEIEEDKNELVDMKKDLKKKNYELKKMMGKTEKVELQLNHEREKSVHSLNNRYLSMYDRISKARDGLAVVAILRNACGGCLNRLPPQRILEIRNKKIIYLCEVCGRILVWDEETVKNG